MALRGGIQRRDLPSQIVVPRPGAELVNAHRHNHPKAPTALPAVSAIPKLPGLVQKVCRTSDREIEREVRVTGLRGRSRPLESLERLRGG